jgi:ATP-binding cassette subfamily B protein
MIKFPHYKQYDDMDCGPACLRIICRYYGKNFSLDYFRSLTHTNRQGTTLLSLAEGAEKTGLHTMAAKLSYNDLEEAAPYPCIAFWNHKHYVVVYRIKRNKVYVSDPAHGLLTYTKEEFLKSWALDSDKGIVLTVERSPEFDKAEDPAGATSGNGFRHMLKYLTRYRRELVQIALGLAVAGILQLIFPFLTQSIVDIGIRNRDISFIYLILLAQLMVFLGKTAVEMVRSYILLHVSARININLLTNFFIKLMRLPLGFFDAKMVGDILQRINDHKRVESFLTTGATTTMFSMLNLVILGIVLGLYNTGIFLAFLVGSVVYVLWIMAFMKKRAAIDYKLFNQMSANQEKNIEMIIGMQEIKLHNAERKKRWQWEYLQVKLFKINIKSLTLKQVQAGGANIINEIKNIVIAFLAARLVIDGSITLGVMLSVTYIIGQLNGPLLQLVEFMQSLQDARLSLHRINEIHNKKDEETGYDQKINDIPQGDIRLEHLSFKYDSSPHTPKVLDNISLTIPAGKVTAIVGASGSGKTTLLKLLLKFYEPVGGQITVGNTAFEELSNSRWRDQCGVVMQEGFIFNDTIAGNIAVGEEEVNYARLQEAAKTANIHDFIQALPLKYNTKIGANGMGISTGQKQRLLIARAIYKNPAILFFDEATSALDAQNERTITENLNRVFTGKTVVVIAHRLSTVKNADRIVVLNKGIITEVGSHQQLISERGYYYHLVKNQLELENA